MQNVNLIETKLNTLKYSGVLQPKWNKDRFYRTHFCWFFLEIEDLNPIYLKQGYKNIRFRIKKVFTWNSLFSLLVFNLKSHDSCKFGDGGESQTQNRKVDGLNSPVCKFELSTQKVF